jgi:hypothetical protein
MVLVQNNGPLGIATRMKVKNERRRFKGKNGLIMVKKKYQRLQDQESLLTSRFNGISIIITIESNNEMSQLKNQTMVTRLKGSTWSTWSI